MYLPLTSVHQTGNAIDQQLRRDDGDSNRDAELLGESIEANVDARDQRRQGRLRGDESTHEV